MYFHQRFTNFPVKSSHFPEKYYFVEVYTEFGPTLKLVVSSVKITQSEKIIRISGWAPKKINFYEQWHLGTLGDMQYKGTDDEEYQEAQEEARRVTPFHLLVIEGKSFRCWSVKKPSAIHGYDTEV